MYLYIMYCICIFLGPFLLTNLLLDDLKKTSSTEGEDVRIVIVSSSIHEPKSTKRTRSKQFHYFHSIKEK